MINVLKAGNGGFGLDLSIEIAARFQGKLLKYL
jgi:hypothetical protein